MMCWASRHVKLGLEEETNLSIRIFELILITFNSSRNSSNLREWNSSQSPRLAPTHGMVVPLTLPDR